MSRKYRHQGYMDTDRRDDRNGGERRKPPPRTKPLTPEEKAQLRGVRHATPIGNSARRNARRSRR